MKNSLKFIFAFGITMIVLSYFSKNHKSEQSRKLKDTIPFYLGCDSPEEGSITVDGNLVVHQDFVEKFDLIKNPKAAVSYQLSYLQGYFYYSSNQARLITEDIAEINIKSTKVTKYNRDLEIVKDDRYFHYLYPKSYGDITKIKRDDQALEIKYSAKINSIKCLDFSSENIYAKLPIDPYLAYWSLPQEKFKTFKAFGRTTLTNPCVSLRYIQVSYPPDFWYFWKPDASGIDFFKEKYNCNADLIIGKDIIVPKINFKSKKVTKFNNNILKLLEGKDLKLSVILGLINKHKSSDFEEISKVISNKNLVENILQTWTMKGNDFTRSHKDLDPSLWAVINNIKEIQKISSDLTWQYSKNKDSGIVTLRGRLNKTKRKYEVKIYIGAIGKYNKYDEHWKFLKTSLKESQFILYISHSDYGKNFDIYKVKEKLNLNNEEFDKLINTQPYQLYGALNCFSTTYHSVDYFSLRHKELTSDILLMASEGYTLRIPFGILNYFDKEDSFIKNIRMTSIHDDRIILRRKNDK